MMTAHNDGAAQPRGCGAGVGACRKAIRFGVLPSAFSTTLSTTLLVVLLGGFMAAGPSVPARAAVEYDFTLIEAFEVNYDLREVMLRDINEAGRVSGTATHEGFYDGFFWTPTTEKVIVPLLWPQGINNLNQVVSDGTIYDMDTGATVSVPPAGGWPVPRLQAINDAGVAVGFSECACSNSDRVLQSALVWDAQRGSRTIPVTAAKELLRINGENVAVGNIRGGSAGSEGFRYNVDTGALVNLTDLLPPYLYGRGYSELQDINEAGVVCGRGWDGQAIRGLVWSDQAGFTFLPPIDGGLVEKVFPRGINASGTVVGFADLTAHDPRAFVWDAQNGMRNLNDLAQLPANFILDWAIKINDQGVIVGIGHYGPAWGSSRGFVLTPHAVVTAVDSGAGGGTAGGTGGTGRGAQSPSLGVLANPVVDRLAVRYAVPLGGTVRLSVFDVAGRRVARVVDAPVTAGAHTAYWTPPSSLPSGVYVVRLEAGAQARAARFVVVH